MKRTNQKQRIFPRVSAADWRDWRWQLAHSARSAREIGRALELTDEERRGLRVGRSRLPVAITPYYLSLLDPADPADPLRRIVIPRPSETHCAAGERSDPLGEDAHMPVPGLVHTYPHKVLFLVTDRCPAYCRFCTRARRVGRSAPARLQPRWNAALDYIRAHPEVNDVLLSGGDPLTLSDEDLDWLLSRLRAIRHVDLVRIGSRAPATLPQRITPSLLRVLLRHRPLWMSLHFAHPAEITPEARRACNRLADAGIPLCNQTVLLRDINDSESVIHDLSRALLSVRVKPYYLHLCDMVRGIGAFRTDAARGLEIVRSLVGRASGYAVPLLMVDAPGGGGKVPVMPEFIEDRRADEWIVHGFDGRRYRYPARVDSPAT